MSVQDETTLRRGREGGRWINERPTSEEFAQWFKGSMQIDSALDIEKYIGGVVLIPAVDTKAKYVTGFTDQGVPVIEQREELSYVPYAKVESRIDYFWDLLEAHDEWVASIEHIQSPRLDVEPTMINHTLHEDGKESTEYKAAGAIAQMVHQLPEGYSLMSVPVGEGYSHFLCCTVRVSIFRTDEDGNPKGLPLRTGRGTKQVPLTKRGYQNSVYADDSSMMKAETGAMGRALGFAGIFVIPGSGVATAEDMLEALAQGETPTQAAETAGPAAPTEAPVKSGAERSADEQTELRTRAVQLYKQLQEEHPGKVEEFTTWAHSRKLKSLTDAKGAMLRGVVSKLEKLADQAEREGQQAPEEVPSAQSSEASEEASDAEPGQQAG